jgi:hypothetical protein
MSDYIPRFDLNLLACQGDEGNVFDLNEPVDAAVDVVFDFNEPADADADIDAGEGRAARSDRELESWHAAAACAIDSSMQEAKQ